MTVEEAEQKIREILSKSTLFKNADIKIKVKDKRMKMSNIIEREKHKELTESQDAKH